jgi:hypothetical protein
MNKLTFYLATFLSSIILILKCYFIFSERTQHTYAIGVLEVVILIGLLFYSLYLYVTKSKKQNFTIKQSLITKKNLILIVAITLLISISFLQTTIKKSLDWDAVALYDARATFMLNGVKFSEMKNLTTFDYKNKYYYSLYPPFTSLLHFSWYNSHIPLPVSVIYSFMLLILAIGLFAVLKPRIGITWSLLVTITTIGQQSLFSTSLIAYSNLPYTLYLAFGILLLHKYLIEKEPWWLYLGAILVASSQWIRFLELSWLAVILSFILANVKIKNINKTIKAPLTLISTCVLSYTSWKYFSEVISEKDVIFQFSILYLLDPVVGIFTGSFLVIFIAFIKMWGSVILVYLSSIIGFFTNLDDENVRADFFLIAIIVISFVMYLAGLYFISFQFDWWVEMGGSMLRSSTFLLPLSIYLIAKTTKSLFKKKI